jgi:hypothetical protein
VAIKNPSSISERCESGVQERLPVVGVASIHTISTAATKDAAYRFARRLTRSPFTTTPSSGILDTPAMAITLADEVATTYRVSRLRVRVVGEPDW